MYHVIYSPPRIANRCDNCGGELYQRVDDAQDTVRTRLEVYTSSTRPLLDYYRRLGTLAEVEGTGEPDEIKRSILAAVGMN
jgi:adenylate kinase